MTAPHLRYASPISVPEPPAVASLTEMIFNKLPHRDEDSTVLLGHDDTRSYSVSLPLLRTLLADLFEAFEARGIEPGATALLVSDPDNHELFPSVMLMALASYGVRVFLPMYAETADLATWCDIGQVGAVFTAASELAAEDGRGSGHALLGAVHATAARLGLPVLDLHRDFELQARLQAGRIGSDVLARGAVKRALGRVDAGTEAVVVTTSGSSGSSRLVVYAHGAYPRQCASWQAAGLYAPELLGGRGFTPLFAHTIGIRSLMNAIWTGVPVCLVDTESFATEPERVVELLRWMGPEHLTGGPALFRLLLGLLEQAPAEAAPIAAKLRCLVSIGAPFDDATADEVEAVLGLRPHNAFGTSETQMVLTTLLGGDAPGAGGRPLGVPLPGVELDLMPVADEAGTYRLTVRTPFGAARFLGPETSGLTGDGFIDTGDLVRRTEDGTLVFAGRVSADMINDGFGVKVPLAPLWARYAPALAEGAHVELFPVRGTPGVAAMLFTDRSDLPPGTVTDPAALAKVAERFADRTRHLKAQLEPFEFRHHVITRVVVINAPVPRTRKGTVSRHRILEGYGETVAVLTDPTAASDALLNVRPGLG